MPSKKRKYNARFPAGRIKKIMQTDEEVGKVAQAVPIIILRITPRTLELFVESLLSKAMQVTVSRNAKTLSPSHVKQCIFAESRFDFLRDLVKNVPDVSAAEEKEMLSAESSPNSSRFSDVTMQTRRLAREDSSSSSSSDVRYPPTFSTQGQTSTHTTDLDHRPMRTETVTSNSLKQNDAAIDLTKKTADEPKIHVNFYQETLNLSDDQSQKTVITPNPKYAQPSTSAFSHKVDYSLPKKQEYRSTNIDSLDVSAVNSSTNVSPVIKIDFSKNACVPEIKVLNASTSDFNVTNPSIDKLRKSPIDLDIYSTGNLQIDEDYDT